MQRGNLNDLQAFLAVARERSFTKAAAKLGVSQSALSHTMRELEARLGVRLLTRTTRSVSPTDAGERLLLTVGPRLEEIDAELAAIRSLREKPAGTIRITATDFVADTILLPKLAPILREYPDIKVEIIVEYALTDIVALRYDAGVRSGEQVAKDMIAVRIGPDIRMAVVGAPSYFKTPAGAEDAAGPDRPQLHQSASHHPRRAVCLGVRERPPGAERAGRRPAHLQQPRPDAPGGAGRATAWPMCWKTAARPHIAKGRLKHVLADWCPPWPGYHLYYPSRRQSSAAFGLVVDALRYRGYAAPTLNGDGQSSPFVLEELRHQIGDLQDCSDPRTGNACCRGFLVPADARA